ncbi:MAG TPA: hypothetical protein VFH45_02260 [Acidimicrobiales bacterium]|nr:hypothetical protein [Acidimicrobiales bacterium]
MSRRHDGVHERQSDAAWLFGGAMFFVLFFGALLLLGLGSGTL